MVRSKKKYANRHKRGAIKIAGILLFLGLVGIQFVATVRNESDIIPTTDFLKIYWTPKEVGRILQNSCYDCHSNNTQYPWYNKIQPVSWLLEHHIKDGKEELNFNEFGSLSKRRQRSKLKSIMSQIQDDEMPLWSYTLVHRDAKLSEDERKIMLDWLSKLKDSLQ